MKPIKALSFLALIAGFAAPATAQPSPTNSAQGQIMAGPGDGAAGPINQVNRPDSFSLSSSTPGSTVVAPQANSSGAGAAAPLAAQYNPKELQVQSPRDVGSGKAPEAPQPDGFITGVPDLPSVATSTPSSTAQNARGKWEVSEYDALHDQSSGNRRAGQIMAGPGDGAAGPLNAQENNTTYSQIQGGTEAGTYREGGANDTTHRTKKPRRDGTGKRSKRVRRP